MKPIEPGCLALMAPTLFEISGEKSAQIVTVVRRHESSFVDLLCHDCGAINSAWVIDAGVGKDFVCCSCDLTPLGHDPDAITETTNEEKSHA